MSSPRVIAIREARTIKMRDLIISKAVGVIKESGVAGLSARLLAGLIGFTTPILYTYAGTLDYIRQEACKLLRIEYKDKPEELIDILVK